MCQPGGHSTSSQMCWVPLEGVASSHDMLQRSHMWPSVLCLHACAESCKRKFTAAQDYSFAHLTTLMKNLIRQEVFMTKLTFDLAAHCHARLHTRLQTHVSEQCAVLVMVVANRHDGIHFSRAVLLEVSVCALGQKARVSSALAAQPCVRQI